MRIKHLPLFGALVGLLFTSCVDDKYDLSDIDTTVRVNVNDLTIPVNLDEILLSSIIEEGDQIKIINNQYVVSEEGSFNSSDVEIGDFSITSSKFNPTVVNLPFIAAAAAGKLGYFDIITPVEHFKFKATDIPEEIIEIGDLGATIKFQFDLTLTGITSLAKKIEVQDLTLQLPKGLNVVENEGGSYNPTTGELTLPTREITNEKFSLTVVADKVDFKTLGAALDYNTHSVDIEGEFCVKKGKFVISASDILPGAKPTELVLKINYNIPSFPINTFSGRIKYDITGVNISDVDLSDLPDVLSQPGTDIRLANPQIYLSVNNPMQQYDLIARTGLTITAKHGSQSTPYSIDNPYFEIGCDNPGLEYQFCLSPVDPKVKYEGYANAVHVPFTSLSNVLSGNGLPTSLGITLDNPCLPDQKVTDLRLGTDLGEIGGKYQFIAPIALCEGSKIVYNDVIDGWSSDDLNEVTIEALTIKATITTDVPLNIDIAAYPIDIQGKQINNVKIEGAKLSASSQPQDITITITGAIKHLDGVNFTATASAPANEQVLSPDMNIKVTNLRPSVSGYYEKEL